MTPSSSASGELWGYYIMPSELTVDVLLPNGLIIPLFCSRNHTLRVIKDNLWLEAKKQPLFNLLQVASAYVFVIITLDGNGEEVYDESRRLCDLHMFWPLLRLVEPVGNLEEKAVNYRISQAAGRSLAEFDETSSQELIETRISYFNICQQIVSMRTKNDPCDFYTLQGDSICDDAKCPSAIGGGVRSTAAEGVTGNEELLIAVAVSPDANDTTAGCTHRRVTVKVACKAKPSDVIRETFRKMVKKCSEESKQYVEEKTENFILKIGGKQLYMMDDVELYRYSFIKKCLMTGAVAHVLLVSRSAMCSKLTGADTKMLVPNYVKRQSQNRMADDGADSLWMTDLNSVFKLKVSSAYNINVANTDEDVFVKVGLFHGTEPLAIRQTASIPCSDPRWNEVVEFELRIGQLPRATQLCFSLCSCKQKKPKDAPCPLAWVNYRLLDCQDRLVQGKQMLRMWPFPKSFEASFNPIGQNGSNPSRDFPCIQVEFDTFTCVVSYPKPSLMRAAAAASAVATGYRGSAGVAGGGAPASLKPAFEPDEVSDGDRRFLVDDLLNRDPLHDMLEQEKDLVWKLRKFCKTLPDSLPRLLDAVKWTNVEDVAEMYTLLADWPTVSPEVAMELLDVKYPDHEVRRFAVSCLESRLSDDDMDLYMMYLIQVLKYEPFLENDLSRFLLKRALLSKKIGHMFFWFLRVEMDHSLSWYRFGLLLEAYCRGSGMYLTSVLRQVKAIEKLTTLSLAIKECKEDASKFLTEQLQQPDCLEALQNLDCPLDCSLLLGDLVTEDCHVMNSAKRPLWLVWKNLEAGDQTGNSTIEILFKNGDDLRQDMLTLQIFKIMDIIWRSEGIDFCLTPYKTVPMGKNIGMIEVVKHSKTILEIQSLQGRIGALNIGSSSFLHKWVREINKGEKYDKAVKKFMYACAGYCVATFVLGIGDRHQSNIMITEDGRIFHIDFGHFLGHYKKKLGISRERVPFVLTEDFLKIIARGAENTRKNKEFEKFQRLCGEAYLIIHRHARLFITLFTMMLCMGIPELQKLEDINYLRKTLAVDRDDHEALKYFIDQLNDAYEGGWTTKVDWFFHSVKRL